MIGLRITPETYTRVEALGTQKDKFYSDYALASDEVITFFKDNPKGVDVWKFLEDTQVSDDLKHDANVLNEIYKYFDDVKAVGNYTKWKHEYKGTQKRRWIELESKPNTFYPVTTYNVKLVSGGKVKIGEAELPEENIMTLSLKIPGYLQKQGIASVVLENAIGKYKPKFIRGKWYAQDAYDNGESVNLTVFYQKIQEGLSPQNAAMETPTGKIVKMNGFDGVPEIHKMTDTEVYVLFKKKDTNIETYEELAKPKILQDLVKEIQYNEPHKIDRIFGDDASIKSVEMRAVGNDYEGYDQYPNLMVERDKEYGFEMFDHNERKYFELVIKDGQFYNTIFKDIKSISEQTKLIFVMDQKGNIYIGTTQYPHSSFMDGGDVITAGEIKLLPNDKVLLNNYSGHYEPSFESLKAVVYELVSRGVDIRGIQLNKVLESGEIIENPD